MTPKKTRQSIPLAEALKRARAAFTGVPAAEREEIAREADEYAKPRADREQREAVEREHVRRRGRKGASDGELQVVRDSALTPDRYSSVVTIARLTNHAA